MESLRVSFVERFERSQDSPELRHRRSLFSHFCFAGFFCFVIRLTKSQWGDRTRLKNSVHSSSFFVCLSAVPNIFPFAHISMMKHRMVSHDNIFKSLDLAHVCALLNRKMNLIFGDCAKMSGETPVLVMITTIKGLRGYEREPRARSTCLVGGFKREILLADKMMKISSSKGWESFQWSSKPFFFFNPITIVYADNIGKFFYGMYIEKSRGEKRYVTQAQTWTETRFGLCYDKIII